MDSVISSGKTPRHVMPQKKIVLNVSKVVYHLSYRGNKYGQYSSTLIPICIRNEQYGRRYGWNRRP